MYILLFVYFSGCVLGWDEYVWNIILKLSKELFMSLSLLYLIFVLLFMDF